MQDIGAPSSPKAMNTAQINRPRSVAPRKHHTTAAPMAKLIHTVGASHRRRIGSRSLRNLGITLNTGQYAIVPPSVVARRIRSTLWRVTLGPPLLAGSRFSLSPELMTHDPLGSPSMATRCERDNPMR